MRHQVKGLLCAFACVLASIYGRFCFTHPIIRIDLSSHIQRSLAHLMSHVPFLNPFLFLLSRLCSVSLHATFVFSFTFLTTRIRLHVLIITSFPFGLLVHLDSYAIGNIQLSCKGKPSSLRLSIRDVCYL